MKSVSKDLEGHMLNGKTEKHLLYLLTQKPLMILGEGGVLRRRRQNLGEKKLQNEWKTGKSQKTSVDWAFRKLVKRS